MRQLLDAGIHFGHQSHRWNPKMKPYLFGIRNGIHIIDLQQTVPLLHNALVFLYEIANNNGKILFVGTKRQAQKPIQEAAMNNNQFYVTHRWPGGMLTNWKTISQSIKQLDDLDFKLDEKNSFVKMLTKKERLNLQRKQDKLNLSLGGIRNMNGIPDAMIIFDTNKEKNALEEAKVLKIPIVAIIDSNSNPDGIDFPIPGNDDATRALKTFCELISDTIAIASKNNISKQAEDIGETDILVEDMNATNNNDGVKTEKKEENIKDNEDNTSSSDNVK
jgi:small subunit ribosomal protein S2